MDFEIVKLLSFQLKLILVDDSVKAPRSSQSASREFSGSELGSEVVPEELEGEVDNTTGTGALWAVALLAVKVWSSDRMRNWLILRRLRSFLGFAELSEWVGVEEVPTKNGSTSC